MFCPACLKHNPLWITGIILVAAALRAAAAIEYQVLDLGTLGGTASAATGLNDRGEVVGWSLDADGRTNAFVWRSGTMTSLGFLPGGEHSVARAINNHGEITGRANVSPTNFHAFRYADGVMASIGTLGGTNSMGTDINAAGTIAGWSMIPNNINPQAFLRIEEDWIHIPPLAPQFGNSEGFAVNSRGQVCGITFLWANNERWWGFVWQDANTNRLHDPGEMQVLGALGEQYSRGSFSAAYDINDYGQVVGWTGITNTSWPKHAFLVTPSNGVWKIPAGSPNPTNHLMQSLGVLGGPTNNSRAHGINHRTWVVGTADMSGGPNQAFLWREGGMLNLNDLIAPDSGWVLTDAVGINVHNEIAGTGLMEGQTRAYLLRREGRITSFDPVFAMTDWVYTNEWNELVTQSVVQAEAHVLQWSGIWNEDASVPHGFTVESCDDLATGQWVPHDPTSQWPVAEAPWVHPADPLEIPRRFFRVRAHPVTGPD